MYATAELGGAVEYQGVSAYKVTFIAKGTGLHVIRYYAQDTLLPIANEVVADTEGTPSTYKMVLSDYREVGGIKFAFKSAVTSGMIQLTTMIDAIEVSPTFGPTTFAVPPEVKALIK